MSQVKLGDVAVESRETYKRDKTGMPIVGLEHLTPGEVTLSNWATDTDNTFTKRFRKGDMLFGRRRAYLKKAAQAPFDGICSGDITVIRAKEDLLLPELLPFIIQNDNLFDFAVGKSAGSLSPRVKWDNLKNYTFELPSMEEQKKLAEVLWSINDTLQAYQELLIQTDELIKSQFIEQFGNTDNVPNGWEKTTIGQACKLVNGRAFKPSDWTKEGTPIVRIQNLNDPMAEFNYCTGDIEKKFWIDTGSLLFAWSGTPGTSFGAFIWNGGKAVLNQHIFQVYPKDNISKPFLKYSFDGHIDEIMEKAHGGVGLRHITKRELEKIQLLIPPRGIQDRFVAFAFQNENAKSALQNTITSLQATKRRILENALRTGRKE